MLPQQYCLRWKYHHSNLQTMFSQLLDRGCFCDVTLACEGQLIRAHRVVLCACSSFFDTVLTNYASERDPIIIMKDVTFADVKCLIEFMYKGEINVEHANLASLLKTADDLKIKGLAEVSFRDDEDGPPLPTAATEFHSPTPTHGQDMYSTRPEQQRVGSPSFMPPQRLPRERKLSSPKDQAHAQQGLPTLTPLPPTSSASMVAVAAAAAAAAAAASAASPVESYLGPKRKRGRPPLDDAYDVFNVRKLAQYGSHLDAHHHHQAYLEAQRQYNDEQRRLAVISPIPPPSSTSVAAAAAYHQHIQQQQHNKRMRQLHRQQQQQQQHQLHHHQLHTEADELEHEDAQADPEWINSNLEVNVGGGGDNEPPIECDADTETMKEHKLDQADDKEAQRTAKIEVRKRKERQSEERDKLHVRERSLTRKRSSAEERDDNNSINDERKREERQSREHSAQNEITDQTQECKGGNVDGEEEEKVKAAATVPQPVEEMENVRQSKDKLSNVAANTTTSATSGTHKRGNITSDPSAPLPLPPPPSLHHPAHPYGKYAPEGYLLNEHGILMTHDFVHAPTAPITATGATASSSSGAIVGAAGAANGNDQDYVDIKMEEYDGTDLRLTTEEISEWQDVIKMDDYLAKGRRPQFWEEPFTRRVLDAIKNKRLEMKKAARILGVSYGTLYGRYREVYGCLKHPYSSSTFRPTQSNQLAVQPRFDMVWPSPKRDSGIMPGQLEIGKIRPKDLSELWTRPQI